MTTSKRKPAAGITDRLAAELRLIVALMPSPEGCRACLDSPPCPLHRRRRSALEVLRELESGE